jgi:hypothetical protein
MSPNKLLQIVLFITSISTIVTNGILMIKEKDTLDFKTLTDKQDYYVGSLIYNEFFMILLLTYIFLFYIYETIVGCCSDKSTVSTFSIFKILFIISGIVSHVSIMFYLFIHSNYIDENITNISIIFTTNFLFSIVFTLGVNIYKCYHKKDYDELNEK